MQPDLELALELADIAAEIAVPRFDDRQFTTTTKPDGSPVTDVDRAVERALRERLRQQRPDHAILGEEYGASGESDWRWYLDPIDGTSRFVDGDPNWMTFVALEHAGEVVAGVIAVPALNERWWAGRGEGAFHDGEPIAVSPTSRLADAVVNDDWAGTLADEQPDGPLAAIAREAALVRGYMGHGFLTVAAGIADVALASGGYAWDYAAAKILVEEAGGRFTDLAGGSGFDGGNAVVTNGLLHDQVLGVLRASTGQAERR
jgi:histidinol-phosphatase